MDSNFIMVGQGTGSIHQILQELSWEKELSKCCKQDAFTGSIWSSGDFYKEVTKLPLGWRCCRMRTRWHDKAKLSHLKRDDWRDNFFLLAGENLFRKWFFNLTRWLSVTWDQKTKNWNLKGHIFIRQQFLKSAIHWESKAFFILPRVYNIYVFTRFMKTAAAIVRLALKN